MMPVRADPLSFLGSTHMNPEEFRSLCLAQNGASESLPFGPDVLVFKVGGKIFATLALNDQETRANLKCEPERAIALREEYPEILPGYHMNKKHWNTLLIDSLSDHLIEDLVRHSHALILAGIPKKRGA